MEDSCQFLQWALSTLQHEHPPATPPPAADQTLFLSLPELWYSESMAPGEPPAREGHRSTNSCSSGDTDSGGGASAVSVLERDRDGRSPSRNSVVARQCAALPGSGSGGTNQPVSWNFNAAASAAQPSKNACRPQTVPGSPPTTRRAPVRILGSAPYAQDHIIAERKRREKINQRFIELSTVIPGLKKMDKATILSDATKYVKGLQEKLKALEDGGGSNGRRLESSAVRAKKPRIAVPDDDDEDGRPPSVPEPEVVDGNRNSSSLPEIEASVTDRNVMVRIHCDDARGVFVRLLAEVEGLHLSITNANVMPFTATTLVINVVAKVEEGFNTTADGIVGRLDSALHQHGRNNSIAEETRSCC